MQEENVFFSINEYGKMTDEEIIENMAAELYKLNDINRQKLRTNRWVIRSFSSTLITASIICILIVVSVL